MTSTCAFVFARGGSKGLPRKNLLSIAGMPLLAHSITLSKGLEEVDSIYVSTDCPDIAAIAEKYGAEVIERPANLATDHAPEWLAWQHAITYVEERKGCFDKFLSLPTTAPLRRIEDVRSCLNALQPGVDLVLTMKKAHRNPWFNMVTTDKNDINRVHLLANDLSIIRRQDAPVCFDLTTVAYVARPEFVIKSACFWEGKVVGVEIPVERSIDIDSSFDFKMARFLMENDPSF